VDLYIHSPHTSSRRSAQVRTGRSPLPCHHVKCRGSGSIRPRPLPVPRPSCRSHMTTPSTPGKRAEADACARGRPRSTRRTHARGLRGVMSVTDADTARAPRKAGGCFRLCPSVSLGMREGWPRPNAGYDWTTASKALHSQAGIARSVWRRASTPALGPTKSHIKFG
jgi:hypothetical protein